MDYWPVRISHKHIWWLEIKKCFRIRTSGLESNIREESPRECLVIEIVQSRVPNCDRREYVIHFDGGVVCVVYGQLAELSYKFPFSLILKGIESISEGDFQVRKRSNILSYVFVCVDNGLLRDNINSVLLQICSYKSEHALIIDGKNSGIIIRDVRDHQILISSIGLNTPIFNCKRSAVAVIHG